MAVLPKAIYVFKTIPMKIPMAFITDTEKSILKFIWNHKKIQIARTILSKKNNTGDIIIHNFKNYTTVP
jgi:hypothetical protein